MQEYTLHVHRTVRVSTVRMSVTVIFAMRVSLGSVIVSIVIMMIVSISALLCSIDILGMSMLVGVLVTILLVDWLDGWRVGYSSVGAGTRAMFVGCSGT